MKHISWGQGPQLATHKNISWRQGPQVVTHERQQLGTKFSTSYS